MTMTPLDMFGLFAVILMLVVYALEKRHHIFILLFSLSCLLGSAYGFLQGAWPFGVVELVWTAVVGWRWWKEYSGEAGRDLVLYVPLLDEGTEVWRPATAVTHGRGRYRITSIAPDGETWAFNGGDIVRAEPFRHGLMAVADQE
jgi:hypothetical protein